ncbi:hypothetical protein R6Q57_008214 [Mikania cordata]
MELLSASQQECQDILDSVQDSTALDYDSYSPRLSLKIEIPQVDSKKPIRHTRKTFKLKKNKGRRPIWGSLPFCSNENANDDQPMGVKVGGCDGEMNIGAVNSAGITIVGSSLRDLMRRKRYRQGKPLNVEIYHDVKCKVTPDKESNKTIISSPRKKIWCYEHIIIGRPKLLDYPSIFPRVCRWESSARHYSMSSQFNINFEELEHNHACYMRLQWIYFQILWKLEPTSEEVEIDIIREIPQEWCLKTRLGTIEQPIEIPCESAVRMVKVHREVVEEEEDEDPMKLEKSTIFVLSDDEESKVNEDLKKEILELKVIIEEMKENEGKKRVENEDEIKELRKKVEDNEERRMRVQDENEELRKWVQDEKELRKRVQGENEKLRVRVQNESEERRKRIQDVEELRERVQYEEDLRKGVQNENEKLRKRVQDEEELRKRVQDEYEKQRLRAEIENEELRKRIADENELRKIVRDENEKLRKRIKDEEELIKRVQDEEELRKKVQDENEKRRRRVQHENDELRKRIQDEEELKKKFRYEEELRKRVEDDIEQLRKRVQDENELRKRVQTENEELMKRVQDEVEVRKEVQDENVELRKIVEDEQELRKIVEAENEKLHAENTLMEGCILDLERLLSKDSVDL